ncbi:MAG TPA: hypothetical protein VGL81_02955 [Polyangiaceae bacterium]|jgi:hypothetical protein
MRGARRALGASALAAAILASVAPARAGAGDDASAEHGADFVDVAVAAQPEEAAALLDTLRELLSRLGLGVRATTGDGPPWTRLDAPPDTAGERARVWIDARDPAAVSVDVCALREGPAPPILHRSVPRDGSSAVVVDTVGHVVEATLESALLEPLPRVPPPPLLLPAPPDHVPAVAAPIPALRHGGLALDGAAFVDGAAVAPRSGVTLGGGGAVIVSAGPIPWRPSLWMGASFQTPFDVPGPGATLETSVSSFRAIPSVELVRFRTLQLDFGAGGGADVFHDTPRDVRSPFQSSSRPQTHVSPLVAGQLLARLRLGPSARLLVGLDLDWDPQHRHYDVLDRFGNASAVLQPLSVRTGALVGICVPLAGASACGGQ